MSGVRWQLADDDALVHGLVELSDRRAAERSSSAPPTRNPASTHWLVSQGFVHVGWLRGRAVATITVRDTPPFDLARTGLPTAERPRYMQRLAVDPDASDPLLGLRAVRRAITVASEDGADALRAEANPELVDVLRLLTAAGFSRFGTDVSGALPRTYLQRALGSAAPE